MIEAASLTTDAWLAGFIDGEGHFGVSPDSRHGLWSPRFELSLRDDDKDVLVALRDTFGGCLKIPNPRVVGDGYQQKPQLRWQAISKASLSALVEYLDEFPLRAKKAGEYAIWREAVHVYVDHGGRAPVLVALADQLKAARRY